MVFLLLLETQREPGRCGRAPRACDYIVAKWADREARALTAVPPRLRSAIKYRGRQCVSHSASARHGLAAGSHSQAARAEGAAGPIHVATYVEVGSASDKDGVKLLKQYRDASRKENGNLRAEVAQEIGRANRFVVLEIWKDQAAFDAHGKSAATTAFRDKLKAIQNAPL